MQDLHIDVLVQERHNSIADALELRLSCTNPSFFTTEITVRLLSTEQQSRNWNEIKWSVATVTARALIQYKDVISPV